MAMNETQFEQNLMQVPSLVTQLAANQRGAQEEAEKMKSITDAYTLVRQTKPLFDDPRSRGYEGLLQLYPTFEGIQETVGRALGALSGYMKKYQGFRGFFRKYLHRNDYLKYQTTSDLFRSSLGYMRQRLSGIKNSLNSDEKLKIATLPQKIFSL